MSGTTRLSASQRRDVFLDAANEIIQEQGIEAVTMEGIAARTGVNKALGYRHFANRDELLAALYERENAKVDASLEEAIAGCTSFEEKLARIVHVYLDTIEAGELPVNTVFLTGGAKGSQLQQAVDQRTVSILQYFTLMVMMDFRISLHRAVLAAAVLSAGLGGLMEIARHTGADRVPLERDFVTMVMGAVRALEATEASG